MVASTVLSLVPSANTEGMAVSGQDRVSEIRVAWLFVAVAVTLTADAKQIQNHLAELIPSLYLLAR